MQIPQSDQLATEKGNKVSAMYHTSEEDGMRKIHNPTRMEAVEFNLRTIEISDFHNTENIKKLSKMVGDLIEYTKFQQKLIDENRVRIQELEKQV
jgi:hypothetical protein